MLQWKILQKYYKLIITKSNSQILARVTFAAVKTHWILPAKVTSRSIIVVDGDINRKWKKTRALDRIAGTWYTQYIM